MPFIAIESPEDNIWEKNPSLELIKEFKELKQVEGEERSSNILKAIYYIWDPKSDIRDSGVSEDKLLEDVTTNMLGPDFNWDDYEEIQEAYLNFNITKLESLLLRYEKEIEDLNKMLEDWKWTKKDVVQKGNAVRQYKMLFDEYIQIKDKARMEAEEMYDMLGGYQKSLIEDYGGE